jgi:hypothetical protein
MTQLLDEINRARDESRRLALTQMEHGLLRTLREAVLGDPGALARLKELDDAARGLREDLGT